MDERESDYKICNCDSNDFDSLPLFKTHSLTPIDEVERLLAKESTLGRKDSNGNTLLHIAGKRMHWPLFKLLLEKGSDLKAKNVCGLSPLDLYLKGQGIRDRAYVVKNHFDLTYQDAEEVFGDKNILLGLRMSGLWYTDDERAQGKKINSAITKGDVDELRRIIAVGGLIEFLKKPSYSPAYLASHHDDPLSAELIKVLKEAGGHILYPGSGNYSLLENALSSARLEIVKAIDPDYPISEPLSRGITLVTIADTGTYMVSLEPSGGDLIVGFGSHVRGEEGGLNYPARELDDRRKRDLEKAGAQWFIPYLEKYVAGEDVVVADLEGEYLERFGEPMKIYYAKWSKEKFSSPSFSR